MIKFLKVTNAPNTGQLISIDGIKSVSTASAVATSVTIGYVDGSATVVLTDAQVDSDVYLLIVNSIQTAASTPWQKPYYEIVSPKAVTSIVNS